MDMLTPLHLFSLLDGLAVAYALVGAFLVGWVTERPFASRPSVAVVMKTYRREWMRQFVTRSPRIYDATVLDGLRQGITFYASACMISIGGGLALVGNTAPLQGLAQGLTLETASALVLQAKILFVLGFLVNAFLKFVWSHRLFGYCSIMMAAVPNDPQDPEAYPRAAQAAEVNITAARNYNRGLRSVYFALGALGWLVGPVGLIATMTLTMATLLRREFASQSRVAILARHSEHG